MEAGAGGMSLKNGTSELFQGKLLLEDPWYRLVMKMLPAVGHDHHTRSVLEIGCGFGGFCVNVAKMGAHAVGVDVSVAAVRKAKDLATQSGTKDCVDLVVGDAHLLPLRNDVSLAVVCAETLEHVDDHKKAFDELVRVTDQSGLLCFTVPNVLSTSILEYLVLLAIGQPAYVKKIASLENEHIFHIFKVMELLDRRDIRVLKIQSTDFLHIPPRLRRALRIDPSLRIISDKIENYLVSHNSRLRMLGANIGVLIRKG